MLYVLRNQYRQNQKEFMTRRAIIKALRFQFQKFTKPRKVKGKSVDSAIDKLGKNGKLRVTLVYDRTIYGKSVVMGYQIFTPLSKETERQIDIFEKIVNHYTIQ